MTSIVPFPASGRSPDYIDSLLGERGALAQRFAGYAVRAGQLELARAVDHALRHSEHALTDAPTGIGKSFAYCLPAIAHAHEQETRVLVVTANIALQEQLVQKDLPLLTEIVPWSFRFALLKGRQNFLCVERAPDADDRGLEEAEREQLRHIASWAGTTATGDISTLPFVPASRVWSRVSVSSDECKGKNCPVRDDCFSESARAIAREADIVVTNYHALFAHLAMTSRGREGFLPPFQALILDEAHAAPDVARDMFGASVSRRVFSRLAEDALRAGHADLAGALRVGADRLFADLARFAASDSYVGRLQGRTPVDATPALTALDAFEIRCPDSRLAEEAASTAMTIQGALSGRDTSRAYWIELGPRGYVGLKAKVVDIGRILRRVLYDAVPCVVAVSATLTTGGTFDFIRRELGVPHATRELVVESPFDFETQAMLVLPTAMPDPNDPSFVEAVNEAMGEVIEQSEGRTLGLFTSHRALREVADHLRIRFRGQYRILCQGEEPRSTLVRLFKEDVSSVLLGTESCWTGLDVPGEALTAVVIDRLPFPHPEDPIAAALFARSPSAFSTYSVPRAAIQLQQGVGRLIRSVSDHGVVVILDRRLRTKPYGKTMLRSLPPMRIATELATVGPFLRGDWTS